MAIVAVCRLAILKRMPATPLTLLVVEVLEALKAINYNLAFVTSDNPAAAGRFVEENFSAKTP